MNHHVSRAGLWTAARRIRLGFYGGLGVLLVLGAGVLLALAPMLLHATRRASSRIWEDLVLLTLASPFFYAGTAIILLMERRWPARKEQKVLSVGLAQDAVWLFFESALRVTILVTYAALLRALFRAKLGFLTVDSVALLPAWVRLCAAVLLIDFIAFFHHWIRHKVRVLWLFHTVHHSQVELNLFTDVRYHVVEYIVAQTVRFLPLMALNLGSVSFYGYAIAHQWYTRFCHANIRTNLGPLRFILVTPQSHRVHHSPHRRHWDLNFGVIFCIWDRLFGTHYRNDREYPRTGIPDRQFPLEASVRSGALFWTPVRQLLYPFGKLVSSEKMPSYTMPADSAFPRSSEEERNPSCVSPLSSACLPSE